MKTPKPITQDDLRPGDVLLSSGGDNVSRLIRMITHGDYSHAAVWSGTDVIEATKSGIKRHALAADLVEQQYIDAYRWQPLPPDPPKHLGDPPYLSAPVLKEADEIAAAGKNFAYDELVMAALVVALSDLPTDPEVHALAHEVLGSVQHWVHEHILGPILGEKDGMICTEVVCTSFWRAAPEGSYAINITIDGSRAARLRKIALGTGVRSLVETPESRYRDLQKDCARFLLRVSEPAHLMAGSVPGKGSGVHPEPLVMSVKEGRLAFEEALKQHSILSGDVEMGLLAVTGPVPAGGPHAPLGCVTPYDLQASPNLDCIGRLPKPI